MGLSDIPWNTVLMYTSTGIACWSIGTHSSTFLTHITTLCGIKDQGAVSGRRIVSHIGQVLMPVNTHDIMTFINRVSIPSFSPQKLSPDASKIVLVKQLPYKITSDDMYDLFGRYGKIRQIRM